MSLKNNNKNQSKLRRAAWFALALVFSSIGSLGVMSKQAYAYGQVSSRSIQMSTSTTGTASYQVGFTETTSSIKNIVIDFCSSAGSPLYGGACTIPTGFSAASASFANITGLSGWTISPGANHVTISSATVNSASGISFTLGNITNPTTTGTFYARIYTYAAQTNDYVSVTNPSSGSTVFDFGGIALSTANVINVTAKVQETMTFCVSQASPGAACSGATTPTVTLGHGSPAVIDSSVVDTNASVTPTYMQITTNASGGAVIRMKTNNACAGLSSDGGTTCPIPPIGGTGTAAITAGTAKFGMFVGTGAGGTGTLTPDANYTGPNYGMETANVTSTYGDPIASTVSAPTANMTSQLTFGATASPGTQAGVYTANLQLIATGTY
jgi:hypothetical protein